MTTKTPRERNQHTGNVTFPINQWHDIEEDVNCNGSHEIRRGDTGEVYRITAQDLAKAEIRWKHGSAYVLLPLR